MGFYRAGFDVTGLDLHPQPSYPFEFIQADVVKALDSLDLSQWDAFAASVPCQAFTKAKHLQGNAHPDLIAPVRDRLLDTGKPFVMENVPGAPLANYVTLCGTMFGLGVYRHRWFEPHGFALKQPVHPEHLRPQVKMGRPPKVTDYIQVVGHFSGADHGRAAMGIHWMRNKDELAESIPPAFTEYVGRAMRAELV